MMENLDNGNMDKRLRRIERWLKRCMVACRCGSWSSALMEVECMEAETQAFRDELWRTIEESVDARPRVARVSVLRVFRIAAIAMIIVMTAVFPLSVDQDRPFSGFGTNSIEMLTRTESDFVAALREALSSGNKGRVVVSVEIPEEAPVNPAERGAAVAAEPPASSARPAVSTRRVPQEAAAHPVQHLAPRAEPREGPSVDEVIALIQVGQRALRVSEPAVKVLP